MLEVERVEDWIGEDALDAEGERVGRIDEVFYASSTDQPTFVAIKSGLLGRHNDVVPLAGATVGRDYVRLGFSAALIEQARSEVDVGDTIEQPDARRLSELYRVEVSRGDQFEGTRVIEARAQAAQEARDRAAELERQAQLRAAEAEDAQGAAQAAQQDAEEKARQSQRARADAESAREGLEEIIPPPQ